MKIPQEVARERERQVWEMRQKMMTQEQIAEKVGISQPAVNKILKRLTSRFAARFSDDIERVKNEQIAQLEHVATEAMQAWERSKEPAKTAWVKRPLGIDGKPLTDKNGKALPLGEQTNEVRDQDGDPRYLTVAMKAKEDIRKIIGAEAPQKTELTGKDGNPIAVDYQTPKARLLDKLARFATGRGEGSGDK